MPKLLLGVRYYEIQWFLRVWEFFFFLQVRGMFLVEMFCEIQMNVYEKAVGESFTELAFEAVEKIINVS